ncbi:MAG: ATP-binding cassette domain-containing protein [Bacteroidaceae bacterium]|nr:ATP-binding cassette domain-containing protein [Bacteroidaceae bacterium]
MEKTLIINFKEVDIKREDNTVLYNVNFNVSEGDFIYLTGVVGSGKSSLLKTIYGELDVPCGTAEVLGYDMRHIKRRHIPALRRQLGIVFQDFRLLTDRNVRRNLDFVLRSTGWKNRTERAERIRQVLETVGLADKQESMPYQLSGGEQQRVCIARAILNRPRIILADEATGNQDSESGLQTARILYELAQQGTAVVFATHNNALIEQFPGRVYECRNNQFICHDDETEKQDNRTEPVIQVRPERAEKQESPATREEPVEAVAPVADESPAIEEVPVADDIPVATITDNTPEL